MTHLGPEPCAQLRAVLPIHFHRYRVRHPVAAAIGPGPRPAVVVEGDTVEGNFVCMGPPLVMLGQALGLRGGCHLPVCVFLSDGWLGWGWGWDKWVDRNQLNELEGLTEG